MGNEIGKELTIENQTDSNIRVEWWTAGWGFKVADYIVSANSERAWSKSYVWYEVKVITGGGDFHDRKFYGGASAYWRWDGNDIHG